MLAGLLELEPVRTKRTLVEARHRRSAQAFTVEIGAFAFDRPIEFVEAREVRDAHQRFISLFERDQHAPELVAANKVSRAVDGVDDPAPAAHPEFGRAFLAEVPVVGEFFLDGFANQPFIVLVRDGDGRRVVLGFGGDALRANADGVLSGGNRHATGEIDFSDKAHGLTIIRVLSDSM